MNEQAVNALSVAVLIVVPAITGLISFFQRKKQYWPPRTARDRWKCIGIPLVIAGAAAIVMFFAYTMLLFILFERTA